MSYSVTTHMPPRWGGFSVFPTASRDGLSEAHKVSFVLGASAHIAIQIAKHCECKVFVFSRKAGGHQDLAKKLGADWVGATKDTPPERLEFRFLTYLGLLVARKELGIEIAGQHDPWLIPQTSFPPDYGPLPLERSDPCLEQQHT